MNASFLCNRTVKQDNARSKTMLKQTPFRDSNTHMLQCTANKNLIGVASQGASSCHLSGGTVRKWLLSQGKCLGLLAHQNLGNYKYVF